MEANFEPQASEVTLGGPRGLDSGAAVDYQRLRELDPAGRLLNEDLAPAREREWKGYSIFALWMSDVHSVGGYTYAAGLFFLGLVGWQVLLAVVLGSAIVLVGVNLVGWAGQKTGVPYAVFARISFGVFGGNLPALIRAIPAIIFYGVQTYLASVALLVIGLRVWPSLRPYTHGGFVGLSPAGWVCFGLLWALQFILVQRGMRVIRKYVDWAGPAIWVMMIVLAVWIVIKAHGHLNFDISPFRLHGAAAWGAFFAALALTVSYFVTPMLNYADFSRFAPNRRAVSRGNLLGVPINLTAFAILTVVITAGTITVYGTAITNPVLIVGRVNNTPALILGAIVFATATIGINVVANYVSPAYDVTNLWPKFMNFRRGGAVTAILAVVVLPWKLYSTPVAIDTLQEIVAAFLGPLLGVILVDYYLRRRRHVVIEDLYRPNSDSTYFYQKGWNVQALAAFGAAAVVCALCTMLPALHALSPFVWFIGLPLSGLLYFLLSGRNTLRRPTV